MSRTLRLAALLSALLACQAGPPTPEELGVDSATISSHLDPPVWGQAEAELDTGRLTKIPVSRFATYQVDRSGAHDLRFRVRCLTGDAHRCDPALLLTTNGGNVSFNDNASGQPGPRDAFLDPPAQASSASYVVRAFSRLRATSYAAVEYSADGGATWIALSPVAGIELGGTLVRVGALTPGDFIEVQSRSGAQVLENDTQMALFSTTPGKPLFFSENRPDGNRDPRIDIAGYDFWNEGNTFVLLGKSATLASNRGVETHVDLVHGPTGQWGEVALSDVGKYLLPGRYLLSVFARIDLPVGAYHPGQPATYWPSSQMPVLYNDGCPNNARDGLGETTWYRGAPNDKALKIVVERKVGANWQHVHTRTVPRGAFGSRADLGDNRFAVPIEQTVGGEVRVKVVPLAGGVTVAPNWAYERNPEVNELKVVSANALYTGNSFNHAKYRNLANLLGTRGSVLAGPQRVEEAPDQAPYQWAADVLGLQEVAKEGDGNDPDDYYTLTILDELLQRGSHFWTFVQGRGEKFSAWGWGDGPGMNPIFVNDQMYPVTAQPSSVYFSPAAKQLAGCTDNEGQARYTECALTERGYGDGDIWNFMTAAKLSAYRATGSRPIAFFNVHMEASDGPADFAPRVGELETLMEKVDKLLVADPAAFNNGGSSHPLYEGNRMIIVGDWNVRAHECGEHYWMLRMLRERYGYAVEVSMAQLDGLGTTLSGGHVSDLGYHPNGIPVDYQHQTKGWGTLWQAWQTTHDHDVFSRFPWWAVDWRGGQADANHVGEKLSMIVLVGRGWAHDDPVLSNLVMSDSNHPSRMNWEGRGVEMWRPDDCNPGSVSSDPATGYRPNHSLGCGATPGAPALHTDHRPIGARLRVWNR